MAQALPADFAAIPIDAQDELWLNMDRPNNLMVIDSLVWLRERPDWAAIRDTIRHRMVERYPVFRCRPELIDGEPHWVRDPDFKLSRHIVKASLTAPVDETAVQRFVSSERSRPFDREHPLWRVHLIDNVIRPDGTTGAALLLRVHHSVTDGIRLTEIALGLTDPVQHDRPGTIAAAVGAPLPSFHRPTLGTAARMAGRAARAGGATLSRVGLEAVAIGAGAAAGVVHDIRDPLGAPVRWISNAVDISGDATEQVVGLVADPTRAVDALTYLAGLAPGGRQAANTTTETLGILSARPETHAPWSGTPGVPKQAAWSPPISLAHVIAIGRATGTTVNDALIGAVAGALMRYLDSHDSSLKEIGWLVPVSLQPFGGGMPARLGNHFALVNFRMPLSIKDPRRRLVKINKRTQRIKHSQETLLTFGVQRAIAMSPERMSVALTNYFANVTSGILTNVPGPREEVELAGTVVDAFLGWAPSSGDQPMTVCIYSYAGQVYVAFAVDAGLIPDVQLMVDFFTEEVAHMYDTLVPQGSHS